MSSDRVEEELNQIKCFYWWQNLLYLKCTVVAGWHYCHYSAKSSLSCYGGKLAGAE